MDNESDNPTLPPNSRLCQQCGGLLPEDAPQGNCPACLLCMGMQTASGEDTPTLTRATDAVAVIGPPPLPNRDFLQPGQLFGNYRIGELLGRGGMGEVYEAEDVEGGRRVAIKVLGTKMDSPDARKRFLREGRMAAAINHPNSVYIYGTEEIEDQSVIAMELVERGTLKDKLKAQGQLPVTEAVDDILQIISGLNAAHEKGVLHRDIKPSNCFVDADGSVKVGDFGLSVSSIAREDTQLTMTGTVMGTPAFASPEQLRGDELDVRSDIYSVGATLYYLLLGKAPFEAQNVVQLMATVLDKKPESPQLQRADVPEGLAQIILKCLSKQSDARYRDYANLRKALEPFASHGTTPAGMGLRTLAGIIDWFILGTLGQLPIWALSWDSSFGNISTVLQEFGPANMVACSFLMWLLYFAVPEGLLGASLGKAICRLRVRQTNGIRLGVPRALLRTLLFGIAMIGGSSAYLVTNPQAAVGMNSGTAITIVGVVANYAFVLLLAALFCTVRRRNGYAALHDLTTGSRVISPQRQQPRSRVHSIDEELPALAEAPRVGPYHTLESFEQASPGDVLPGFDLKLRRRVWIRKATDGSDMLSAKEKASNRAGRIRWIGGARQPAANWDAYEALRGRPLITLLGEPQSWDAVRYWALDLLTELESADTGKTLPETIGFDRIWITDDGRAKLLDFSAPGLTPAEIEKWNLHSRSATDIAAGTFVANLTNVALGRDNAGDIVQPLPLHAYELLDQLPIIPSDEAMENLDSACRRASTISRTRRLGLMALCAIPALFGLLVMLLGSVFIEKAQGKTHDLTQLLMHLHHLQYLERQEPDGRRKLDERSASMRVLIAGEFYHLITSSNSWYGDYAKIMIKGEQRELADDIIRTTPRPTPTKLAEAHRLNAGHLERIAKNAKTSQSIQADNRWFFLVFNSTLFFVACTVIPGLIAALAARGGILIRSLGLVIVTTEGKPAERWRVFVRNLLMWLPAIVLPIKILATMKFELANIHTELITLAVLYTIGFFMVLKNPHRGLQDRLAGTCLVPR